MIVDECFQKHSLCNWVEILWFHRSRKDFDFLKEYESNWDGWGSLIAILDIASYIWDVGEAYWIAFCEYVRYSGIVRTMPTYLIWGTPALWGQCLRTLFEILRYCEDNAYVSSLASGYLIWKAALWSLCLWLVADFWLWQWANYFSAMTVYDWILAEKSSRTFYSPRRFGTMRRHLCVKNCFGDGTWGSHVVLYCKRILYRNLSGTFRSWVAV